MRSIFKADVCMSTGSTLYNIYNAYHNKTICPMPHYWGKLGMYIYGDYIQI